MHLSKTTSTVLGSLSELLVLAVGTAMLLFVSWVIL